MGSLVLTGSTTWDILDYAVNYAGGHMATGLYTPDQAAAFLMLAVARILAGSPTLAWGRRSHRGELGFGSFCGRSYTPWPSRVTMAPVWQARR
jgi:hypothetical protein